MSGKVVVDEQRRVVIIGGGMAAVYLLKSLRSDGSLNKLQVSVVSPQNFFENPIASIRFLVLPEFHSECAMAWDKFSSELPNVTFVHATAVEVTKGENKVVKCSNGEELPFDMCVVASGVSYGAIRPTDTQTLEQRQASIGAFAAKVAQAKSILVGGAGPVGTEFVGEILEKYPSECMDGIKNITLVQGAAHCCNNTREWVGPAIDKELESRGCVLMLNSRLQETEENVDGKYHVKTPSGMQEVEAEMMILCRQGKPNSAMLTAHYADSLDEKGFVVVDSKLAAKGADGTLLALGDVNNIGYKNAANLHEHGKKHGGQSVVVATRISAFANGGPANSTGDAKITYTGEDAYLKQPAMVPIGTETYAAVSHPTAAGANLLWCLPLLGGCCHVPEGRKGKLIGMKKRMMTGGPVKAGWFLDGH